MGYKVPAGISNRHIHLSKEDFEVLFGKGKELTFFKKLSQPGQVAAEEKVDVFGPFREQTQVELARTDCYAIGMPLVLRNSGDLAGTPGCKLIGPEGEVEIGEGVIVARRHIHLSPEQAAEAGVKDGDIVSVKFDGERSLIFNEVLIRAGESHYLDFHMDTDEANAASLVNSQEGEILK